MTNKNKPANNNTSTTTTTALTKQHIKTLHDILDNIVSVRRDIHNLKGNDNISEVMFELGDMFNIINKCEDELQDIIDDVDPRNIVNGNDDNEAFKWVWKPYRKMRKTTQ